MLRFDSFILAYSGNYLLRINIVYMRHLHREIQLYEQSSSRSYGIRSAATKSQQPNACNDDFGLESYGLWNKKESSSFSTSLHFFVNILFKFKIQFSSFYFLGSHPFSLNLSFRFELYFDEERKNANFIPIFQMKVFLAVN